MINALNPLNELSDIYHGSISEADNSPEAVKGRVMQYVRAIRYRARKENETLSKAYNEFMGGQSGISSTEKQMVKERLGLTGGSAHVGEGYQRDPEQSKKDKTRSKQPDPSKDGFTGIGNMSINDIMKMNAKIKAKTKKEETSLKDMRRASALSASDNPKDQDEARKIKTQMDYESLMSQKKVKKESFSDWRKDLHEIASDIPVDEKDAEKKIKEKKVNNKITINPVQGQVESFAKSLGGEVVELYEVAEPEVDPNQELEDKKEKAAAAREKQMKTRLLRLKMKGARQGVEGIVAHYEPKGPELTEEFIEEKVEFATEYFLNEGINEEGIDIIIEEIGLENFVDFITEDVQELSEERAARKASVRAKSYADVKADIDKKDAAKKAAKKGEYAPSYAKKETDVTVYDDKPAAKKKAVAKKAPVKKAKKDFDGDKKLETPKQEHRGVRNKKITKAVVKAKIKQPEKKATKQGLGDKIRDAYKAGVKRHRKATQGARVFGKGVAAGAKKAVKFAKDVKKVVSEEDLQEKDSRRTVDAIRAYDKSKDASRDATWDTEHDKIKQGDVEKKYAKKERGEIKKDDPNWKNKKYHTGMHGESLEIQDSDGNLAFEVVDIIKAPPMKTVQPAAQYDLVGEDYETTKKKEVLAAFKRDPKVRKRFEKFAKKEGGPGSAKNRAADDMLQTAKNIAKRKGDTSKSDDRYAYEEVDLKKKSEIVQELFGLGNKKYPYGKATKKNPRGKRDQAELDRAQAYIKKNPNFGLKKEGVTATHKGTEYKLLPGKVRKDLKKHGKGGLDGDYRTEAGKVKDAITDKLGLTNTKRDGVKCKGHQDCSEDVVPRNSMGKPIRIKDKIRAAKGQIPHTTKVSEDKAFNFVRDKLKKKYGSGVLTTGEKPPAATDAQKKAYKKKQEQIAKERAAEFAKDPSQGRYPPGFSNRGSD